MCTRTRPVTCAALAPASTAAGRPRLRSAWPRGAEPSGLRERAAGAWCSQTLRPKLRVCPPLPRGPAGLGAPCQLCKYFGETKVGLPRLKKGNESSWLGSFPHPFEQGWATPAGRRLDPIPPVSGADLLQVGPARANHGREMRERGSDFPPRPPALHGTAERKNGVFFIVTFRGQRHLLETLPQKEAS